MITYLFLLVTGIAAYYFCKTIPEVERKKVFYIFLAAYILRIVIAFVLYKIAIAKGRMGFFVGLDDYYSASRSLEIAQHWREFGLFSLPASYTVHITSISILLFRNQMTYELLGAFILFISNNNNLLVLFVNCFWGAFSIIVLYKISRCFLNKKVSLVSAAIFTIWPSLLFWSVLNLRESLLTFLLLAITLSAIRIMQKTVFAKDAIQYYIVLPVFLFLVYLILKAVSYLVIFIIAAVALIGAIEKLLTKTGLIVRLSVSLLLLCIIMAPFIFSKTQVMRKVESFFEYEIGRLGGVLSDPVKAVEESRQARIVYQEGKPQLAQGYVMRGKSSILPDLHIRSYRDLAMFLPISLVIGLFYPLPWQAQSLMALAAVPEMLAWYVLFPFFIRGIFLSFKSVKRQFPALSFTFLLMFSFFIILPMHDGNAGALFRHRGMVMPFAFMFIAAGIPLGKIAKKNT